MTRITYKKTGKTEQLNTATNKPQHKNPQRRPFNDPKIKLILSDIQKLQMMGFPIQQCLSIIKVAAFRTLGDMDKLTLSKEYVSELLNILRQQVKEEETNNE